MCDPVTALIVVGGVLKAGGSIMSGNAQKDAANAQATEVQIEARQHAAAIRRNARATRGSARADLAASGVVVDQGTPLLIDREIVFRSELDALNELASGDAQAANLRRTGKAAQTAGYLEGAGSLLGSFGGISGGAPASTGATSGGAVGNWSGPR